MSVVRTHDHPHLDKMLERYGTAKLSKMLGISPPMLAPSSLKEGVRPMVEMACTRLYMMENQGLDEDVCYIARISRPQRSTFETVAKALGARLVNVQF